MPTIVTDARTSLPSCHVRLSWKALGHGDDHWTTNDGSRESSVDRLMRTPFFPHMNGSFYRDVDQTTLVERTKILIRATASGVHRHGTPAEEQRPSWGV